VRKSTAVVVLLLLFAALVAVAPAASAAQTDTPSLAKLVTLKAIRQHQRNLDKIADANGGTRSSGTDGFEISARYVIDQLKRAGYTPQRQQFDFAFFEQTAPSVFQQVAPGQETYQAGQTDADDYDTMQYSGAGDVTEAVQATTVAVDDPANDSGCEAAHFAGFTPGNIALIERGTCFFIDKVNNAIAAQASAVIVFNDGEAPDRFGPVLGNLGEPVPVPVLGVSKALGDELLSLIPQGLRLHVETHTISEIRPTTNVIAETGRGRADNVVVVGAHLDSVLEGPGINDNGSGTATVLEIAKQIGNLKGDIKNKVRFAFWGAEEFGLLGSQHYVDNLSAEEQAKIALNLNFDMLGSPNFVRFVYDGDNSSGEGAVGPPGSGAIEHAFLQYFEGRGLATDPTPFDGRSDYGPFIAVGIPAGGLFSGAEDRKTAEQAAVYGGTVGEPLDPCYHQACDTVANNSNTVLDQLSDGAAFVTQKFAKSTLTVNGVARAGVGATSAAAQSDLRGMFTVTIPGRSGRTLCPVHLERHDGCIRAG
jgi:Zn-dependent M28 family amino/carboxypeptidase